MSTVANKRNVQTFVQMAIESYDDTKVIKNSGKVPNRLEYFS